MASPRASSPADATSAPTSPQLTPRSKLKALLAAVDNASSDDERAGPIDPKKLFATIDKNKQKSRPDPTTQDDSADAEDEDEEDTPIIRPRGRMAARMQADDSKPNQTPKSPSNPHSGPIRKPTPVEEGEEEEDIIVAPSRRRLARPNRQSTPEHTAQLGRQESPSLFVSPAPSEPNALSPQPALSDSEDDDVPADLSKNARFRALVEKKRKERLEKDVEEERKRKERAQRVEPTLAESDADADASDISDDDGGRKLTQEVSRPSRKASRKALEEMNRETQRMNRSLQLAHEAKTKKKISKATLFQRFNFRTEGSTTTTESKPTESSQSTSPGSIHHTDAELNNNGTLPSSPSAQDPPVTAASTSGSHAPDLEDANGDLLTLEDALTQFKNHKKDKGKAVDTATPLIQPEQPAKRQMRQVRVKLPPVQSHAALIDIDDELEITSAPKKDRLDAIFSRLPESKAQESTGMKILRNLAQVSSPPKEPSRGRNAKPSMTFGELHMSLQQRAKAQAKLERERRLDYLRSKGIVVQTSEERAREQEQVEDIVARARQEVEEIMLREREEAKRIRKEKLESGELDPLAWDDSDDDSYDDDKEGGEEVEAVDISGSEDGENDDGDSEAAAASEDERASDQNETTPNNLMVMDEADEADDESENGKSPAPAVDDFSDDDVEALKRPTALHSRRSKKNTQIISDDEDDIDIEATPKPKRTLLNSPSVPSSGSPKAPTSVLRSATKSFIPGLPIAPAAPAGLGLTQMFAGTIDDSQAGPLGGSPLEFMPSIDEFPDSQFSATAGQSQGENMVADSQGRETQTQGLQLHYTQSQAHGFDSLVQPDATQMTDFLEATQDAGFQDYTPLKQRFVEAPPSTTGTVLVNSTQDEAAVPESPLIRKRGKLLRKTDTAMPSTALVPTAVPEKPAAEGLSAETIESASAFKIMEKAARRKKKFDKKKSKATGMVQEQAEESEDEYAGLGGADGEDSSDEDEELVKEMIDDAVGNDGDAAKLAGLFADRERAADAAQVDKLFHDITTGGLRKRRRGGDGNNFDLSDSDDGGEARRRMKRRQFAKMQKALFTDERIGKIAENPRNAAFLKTIEDLNKDDEWNFDDNFAETASTSGDDSQSQNVSQTNEAIPDSQPPTTGRKRTRMDGHAPRPGPNERRTKDDARPSSIAEVRRSLSALLEESNTLTSSVIPATEVDSGSDGEEERPSTSHTTNKENRRPSRPASGGVVDRITLKRSSSSSLSTGGSTSASSKLAFSASSTVSGNFKVPALLRRATTNSTKLVSSNNEPNPSATATTSSLNRQASTGSASSSGSLNKAASFGGEDSGKLKKTAGKRSGINYFAHENERRAKVADAEKRREAKKWKGAEGRSRIVEGLFGSGTFE
ncbi:MRC1-like domain-containing protein [Astrocystis sublimbata]|nr:MRC1-like domain-containing protein [Astrocystis sublimbata]